jgi:uncharacterized protein
MAQIEVVDNPARRRYEALVDGQVAGFSQYQLGDDLILFTHTQVDDEYAGHGVASALVRGALDDVRAKGTHKVVPLCPFVRAYIQRHPEYADLLYEAPATSARD